MADNLKSDSPIPRARRRGDPSDGARVRAEAAGSASPAALGDERRHPHPLGHRAGRPAGRRAAPAAGLRRAAQAGRPEAGPARSPARRSRPRPWSTRPTSGWSGADDARTGTAGATSSPRRPRPCAASSSRTPAARRPPRPAAAASGSTSTEAELAIERPARRPARPGRGPRRALAAKDPRKAELVKLRFFAGLTIEQAAEALGISAATADNDWAYARAWLRLAMRGDEADAAAAERFREFLPARWVNPRPISHWPVEATDEPVGDRSMNAVQLDEEAIFHVARRDRRRRGAGRLPRRRPAAGDAALRGRVEALLRRPRAGGELPGVARRGPTADGRPARRGRAARHGHRPLQAAGADRRGRHGRRLHGRADRSPVRRKVALKVIKPGMDTQQVIARFEAERQALALMDHPNIARVLDAGATDIGPALLRDGAGPRRADHRVLRPRTASTSASGWSCSCRSARRCSTPTRRGSSTATSSRPTSW